MGRKRIALSSDQELSTAEAAYRKLSELIITGVLQPGDVLSEQNLVDQLGIGRTPVREAIQRLAWQEVLVVFPRRGVAVAKLGLDDVQALFEARETVEGKLARLASIRRTDEEAEDLICLAKVVKDAGGTEDYRVFLEKDQQLHLMIALAARNHYLCSAIEHLLILSEWIWHQYFTRRGSRSADYFSHQEIVQAIVDQDEDKASAAMIEHVQRSRDMVRHAL